MHLSDIRTRREARQMLTLPEAMRMIDSGVRFGSVYEFLNDQEVDGPQLKFYFVHGRLPEARRTADPEDTPVPTEWATDKPILVVNRHPQSAHSLTPTLSLSTYSGDFCTCGGLMIQDGKCKKCSTCGYSNGSCS